MSAVMQKSKICESTYDMLMYMRYANVLATGEGNASGEESAEMLEAVNFRHA